MTLDKEGVKIKLKWKDQEFLANLDAAENVEDFTALMKYFEWARAENGLSRRELAERCDCEESDIQELEEGINGKAWVMVKVAHELQLGLKLVKRPFKSVKITFLD